ncbi:MAG TPA: metalloregulator ArsR/SmtB family transcription factor [Chthoniobacter sp.]
MGLDITLVQFSHALSDETRLRILHLVNDEALCVCELADILRMPQSSVSSHVQVLRNAGLLASERCEKWIYYRLERRYRSLFATLGKFFALSADDDSTLKPDAMRARIRLAQREQSCWPGPTVLDEAASRGKRQGA